MDCKGICKDEGFSFTWIIENFSYLWKECGESISSPVFVRNTTDPTQFTLLLYPKEYHDNKEDFISFYVHKSSYLSYELMDLDVGYEFSFIAADGSVLVSKRIISNSNRDESRHGVTEFVKREEVFRIRRKDYLPGDVLTARCRIWDVNREITRDGHCFARTRIEVERRSFLRNIKRFSSFRESICEIASTSVKESIMTLKFFPTGGQTSEIFIRVEVCAHNQKLKFSTFHLYLVDSSGNRIECLKDEITFTGNNKTALLTLKFSKEVLMENKVLYLPNDDLQLYCQCAFATGIASEKIEYICYECPSPIKKEKSAGNDLESKQMSLDSTKVLKENLVSSYKENLLCDTKLQTKTGTFPAHKYILSARSPVFKAMFTKDMRERNSDCVHIEDLDDDTVQRMLVYMYTASVQDLQWDSASHLYNAADKYEILSLKSECSSFLKDNLSPDNACDLLILADMHQDQDLKSAVQDYILNHNGILNTNEWKCFMKINAQLAADVMHLMLKELM